MAQRRVRHRVTTRQVSDLLSGLMLLHGMSQRELGRQSGVDQKTISNLIREVSLPRVGTLDDLVAVFGLECWEALLPGGWEDGDVRDLVEAWRSADEGSRGRAMKLLLG